MYSLRWSSLLDPEVGTTRLISSEKPEVRCPQGPAHRCTRSLLLGISPPTTGGERVPQKMCLGQSFKIPQEICKLPQRQITLSNQELLTAVILFLKNIFKIFRAQSHERRKMLTSVTAQMKTNRNLCSGQVSVWLPAQRPSPSAVSTASLRTGWVLGSLHSVHQPLSFQRHSAGHQPDPPPPSRTVQT